MTEIARAQSQLIDPTEPAPAPHLFRGVDGLGWYTGVAIPSRFAVRYLHKRSVEDNLPQLKRIAEQRSTQFEEELDMSLAAVGALKHKNRMLDCAQCGTCGKYPECLIVCSHNCGMAICYKPSPEHPGGVCISHTYDEIQAAWSEIASDIDQGFVCMQCWHKCYPNCAYPPKLKCSQLMMDVRPRASMAPLAIISLIWRGFSASSPVRLIRETFETLYSQCMHTFMFATYWLNASEIVQKTKNENISSAILQFLDKNMNARVLIIVDTHCVENTGSLTVDALHTYSNPGDDATDNLEEIDLESLLKVTLGKPLAKVVLGNRMKVTFGEYTPDPLRGLLVFTCGSHMRSQTHHGYLTTMVDERRVDFVLGFGVHELYPSSYMDGVLTFCINVFWKVVPPWLARERSFTDETRMVGLLPVLIEAVPLDNTLFKSLKQTDKSWADCWAVKKPHWLTEIPKNVQYVTQSSVLVLCPEGLHNFGFPIPRCGYCQSNEFVDSQKVSEPWNGKRKLYCRRCNSKVVFDGPERGKHFLEVDEAGSKIVWPWPMGLAQWRPILEWEPKEKPQNPPIIEKEAEDLVCWVKEYYRAAPLKECYRAEAISSEHYETRKFTSQIKVSPPNDQGESTVRRGSGKRRRSARHDKSDSAGVKRRC
ncbi:hypothetical protein FRC02_011334 [Tulasnella sp. 418]|nr:hypothetical protein FRC02_011334 [Tulasnella sp. 418]